MKLLYLIDCPTCQIRMQSVQKWWGEAYKRTSGLPQHHNPAMPHAKRSQHEKVRLANEVGTWSWWRC